MGVPNNSLLSVRVTIIFPPFFPSPSLSPLLSRIMRAATARPSSPAPMPRATPFYLTLATLSIFILSAAAAPPQHTLLSSSTATPNRQLQRVFNAAKNRTNKLTSPKSLRQMAFGLLAREFLTAHNKVRYQFQEPPLKWDKNLARYARRWGLMRSVDCKMIHTYGPYGENLFWGGRDYWTATQAVESWAREREHYDMRTNGCEPSQMCGHYTQIIWKESLRLGCARVKCATGGLLVICEYDPPGNFINEGPLGAFF